MGARCPNLSACGFFKTSFANSEVVKNNWIQLYCQDPTRWKACERKKLREATGKPPPDNMAPTGKLLQTATTAAPSRRS
jgi:hypothetical protein